MERESGLHLDAHLFFCVFISVNTFHHTFHYPHLDYQESVWHSCIQMQEVMWTPKALGPGWAAGCMWELEPASWKWPMAKKLSLHRSTAAPFSIAVSQKYFSFKKKILWGLCNMPLCITHCFLLPSWLCRFGFYLVHRTLPTLDGRK